MVIPQLARPDSIRVASGYDAFGFSPGRTEGGAGRSGVNRRTISSARAEDTDLPLVLRQRELVGARLLRTFSASVSRGHKEHCPL
jgi:hypothetical protein